MRITPDIWVNPNYVASMVVDRRHYMNGPGDSVLIIMMQDGQEHRIKHEPHYYGGADIYKIQSAIEDRLSSLALEGKSE